MFDGLLTVLVCCSTSQYVIFQIVILMGHQTYCIRYESDGRVAGVGLYRNVQLYRPVVLHM